MTPDERSQGTLRYPDFICIGAQKAGTTWLDDKLRQHRDLWLPPLKEMHYFNALHVHGDARGRTESVWRDMGRKEAVEKAIDRLARHSDRTAGAEARLATLRVIQERQLTDEWYGRIFRSASADVKCGEITPGYALLPETGIGHMVRLCASVKLIFILRDPIDRAWSELRMIRKKINAQSTYDEQVMRAVGNRLFLARSDYMETIRRFAKFVPENRFLVQYFDDLASNPARTLHAIYRFIGVDPVRARFGDIREATHVGEPEDLRPELHDRLKKLFRPAYRNLRALDKPIVQRWIEKHYGSTLGSGSDPFESGELSHEGMPV
ncbi:MAG TPA: sulfotransferase [Rhizomicrobium sp.]|jgi:hypothetical protein|nr:sulfotransferase [Rhizomicrobium sp.]